MPHRPRCQPALRPVPAAPGHRPVRTGTPAADGGARSRPLPGLRLASRAARAAALLALLGTLAACSTALPPSPAALPAPARFAADTGTAAPADTDIRNGSTPDADGRWWRVFGDLQLDALQQQAMQANPRIAEAAARIDQVAARAGLTVADGRPRLALEAGASRVGGPLRNDAGSTGSLWQMGLALQVTPDLGGARTAASQAARHDLEQQADRWQHARLQVQVDVAAAWLAAGDAMQQARWLAALAGHWQHTARLEARRHAAGLATADAADAARAQAAAATARLQDATQQAARHRHALTALLGGASTSDGWPGGLPAATSPYAPDTPGPLPDVPPWADAAPLPAIPPGLPSQLLARRADVAAAGQAVQAARHRLGVADAAGWPALQLTATGGVASDDLASLLRSAARSWSLAGLLSLPLLDGGRRDAQRAAAEAALAEAAAAWRQQMLQALHEVDDRLSQLQALQAEAAAQRQAQAASDRAAATQRSMLARGLASPLAVLDAQRRQIDDRLALARTQAARRQATLALVQALGGGWTAASVASMTSVTSVTSAAGAAGPAGGPGGAD